jgi:excisionase family DNA binding protein
MKKGETSLNASAQKDHPPRDGSLLTTTEVAKWLSVSPGWVRDHATRKQPRLQAVKLGKLLRFRAEDVKEFIQKWCQ